MSAAARLLDGVGGSATSPAFVGRAAEVERLVAAVAAAPSVAMVEGEAGIGKTRLVTELARRPELADRRILTGRCRPIREPFPLGPVLEVVRDLGSARLGSPSGPRLSRVTGALRPLLPELAELLPPLPEPLADRVAERHRVFRGLVEVLRVSGRMAAVLEDMHWADEHTVDFLRYALSDPPADLSWVLTFRGEEVGADLRELTARLDRSVNRARVVLPPLDVPATGELAAAIVGVDRVPEGFAAYLRERTGGLPFAIEEVLALLRDRGVVGPQATGWPHTGTHQLPVPAAVRDHVGARVSRLPQPAQCLLEALAVLRHPATERHLAAVSGQDAAVVAAGLSRAIRSGLVEEDGQTVGFRHVLAAQAVYEGLPGPRRRELHGRAAAVLRDAGEQLLGQVAYHLRHAGRLPEWLVAAERAADQAISLGNDEEAARLLEEVLRHANPAPEVAGRLAIKLAAAADRSVRVRDLIALLLDVSARELPRTVRAELQCLVGALIDRTAGPRQARPLLHQAVRNAGDRVDIKVRAMIGLELRSPPEVPFATRSLRLHQVLELLASVEDPDARVLLLARIGLLFGVIGDPAWRDVVVRIDELTAGPARRHGVEAYGLIGEAACIVGHHQIAERLLETALSGAVVSDNQHRQVVCRSMLAFLRLWCGRWDGLDREVAHLREQLSEETRWHRALQLVSGSLALARGDLDRAKHGFGEVIALAEAFEGYDLLPVAVGSLVRTLLAQGETAAATEQVERYLAAHETDLVYPAMCRGLPWLVQGLVAAGQVSQAAAWLSRCARELQGRDAPLGPAALRHSRGFVTAARGEPAKAARHLLAAARQYAGRAAPYEAALANEEAALALAAAGATRDDLAVPLRAAMATYASLAATRDLARAARTARTHQVPAPTQRRRGPVGYGSELSPREREAAELAATGLTNRRIADELFVSVDTVKKHLGAAMRKLDVPSRTALARHLLLADRED